MHEADQIVYNTEKNCDIVEMTELRCSTMANKFRTYKLIAECTKKKLKEAETVIEQLKSELNVSVNTEKNLRSLMSSAQDRLISKEILLKQFTSVSVQQKRNEQISQSIEETLRKLEEEINQSREKSQNVFKYASREIALLKKVNELESHLKEKVCENDLKKMEIQTLTKEKTNMKEEFQQRVSDLEKELQKSVKKEAETLTLTRETLLYYKKQIEEYEQKIQHYEKERKSLLEDFEPPSALKTFPDFTLADSTVNTQGSSQNCKKHCMTQTDESDTRIKQLSSIPKKSKPVGFKKMKEQKILAKPKPPRLEFLTTTQDSTRPTASGIKRRLFSTNCNHYID